MEYQYHLEKLQGKYIYDYRALNVKNRILLFNIILCNRCAI